MIYLKNTASMTVTVNSSIRTMLWFLTGKQWATCTIKSAVITINEVTEVLPNYSIVFGEAREGHSDG